MWVTNHFRVSEVANGEYVLLSKLNFKRNCYCVRLVSSKKPLVALSWHCHLRWEILAYWFGVFYKMLENRNSVVVLNRKSWYEQTSNLLHLIIVISVPVTSKWIRNYIVIISLPKTSSIIIIDSKNTLRMVLCHDRLWNNNLVILLLMI